MRQRPHTLIPMERLEQAAAALRVLAHPHRLRICELVMHQHVSVNDIAQHLGIAPNAASQHLSIMKAHGLLAARREGKTVYYHVVDPRPGWIIDCIRGHAAPDVSSAARRSAPPRDRARGAFRRESAARSSAT